MAAFTDDLEVVVAAGIDLVLLSRDEVLVQHGTRSRPSELFRDDELTGLLGALVESLRHGPVSVSDLVGSAASEQQDEARRVVEELFDLGVLADARRDPAEQYLRHNFEGDRVLGGLAVSVLGAGALADRIALILLEHGVRVEDGGAGVDFDPGCLTIVALDRFELRLPHLVNRVCLQRRRPWLFAALDANRGLIGPLFIPPYTACFNDYWTLVAATTPSLEMANAYRRKARIRSEGFPGLPVFADVVASHAALAAIHFLLRDTSFAVGRQVVIDFDGLRIDVEDVLKLPRCPVCSGDRPTRRAVIEPEIAAPAEPVR